MTAHRYVEWPSPFEVGQKRRVGFDALPEVAEAEIFVRAVLVIVVIDDGHADPGQAEIFEDIHGDAAAEHGSDDGLTVAGFLHDADQRLRNRQIHAGAGSAVAALVDDFGDQRVCAAFVERRLRGPRQKIPVCE